MLQPVEVIPGILETDFVRITERAKLVAPYTEYLHIDIANNTLVPNTSFLDPVPFQKLIIETGKKFELHMMVDDPFSMVKAWIDVGFKRLLAHVESFHKIERLPDQQIIKEIQHIRSMEVEVGIAIDKQTPVEDVFPYLDAIDGILVMTIKAGFSGQSFIPDMLDKVRAIRKRKPDLPIEVDGGINDQSAPLAIAAGATRIASTSYIFNSNTIEEAIERLRKTSN